MKILIHSNAPWAATGYGQQTAQIARRMRDDGHEVAISAFYGLQGAPQFWEGIPVFPQGMHPYGNDVLVAHAEQHFQGDLSAGLIVTLVDAWVLPANQLRECNVACWAPVDHEPIPPRVAQTLHDIGGFNLAMCRNGEAAMKAAGLDCFYVPHGVDTSVLKPVDQRVARDRTGVPQDVFCVGMVAANKGAPSRKGFSEAFQAFAAFHKKHPDSCLYLHTEVMGAVDGVNLVKLAMACGIPSDAVVPMHQYQGFILGMPAEHMPYVYSSLDVLLNPALGEGFGVPVVEAGACGVPAIVTDWTAMRDTVGPGWKVEGQRYWTQQESWGKLASVESIVGALHKAYRKRGKLTDAARSHALQFDADFVYREHWKPTLEAISDKLWPQEDIGPQQVVVEAA